MSTADKGECEEHKIILKYNQTPCYRNILQGLAKPARSLALQETSQYDERRVVVVLREMSACQWICVGGAFEVPR
jgi:hypothetical protein